MHLTFLPIEIGKLPIVRNQEELKKTIHQCPYGEEGEKERPWHGYRHWPNKPMALALD